MGDTRDRMISAAVETLRRRGLAGTSFTEVLRQSGAPRGVIYHHFPGGKDELAEAAVRAFGAGVQEHLRALSPVEPTPAGVVEAFLAQVRPVVEQSAAGSGCAVAAVAIESEPGSALQRASGEALSCWRTTLTRHLTDTGLAPEPAAHLAALLIITLQGAQVLCRAEDSIAPFDAAVAALRGLVNAPR